MCNSAPSGLSELWISKCYKLDAFEDSGQWPVSRTMWREKSFGSLVIVSFELGRDPFPYGQLPAVRV